MARKASHAISYRLTKFETIAGWLYLPFYLLILNLLLQLANVKFSLGMTALTMNLVYFAVNLLAVLLISMDFAAVVFRRLVLEFCADAGSGLRDVLRGHVGAAIRAFPAGSRLYDLQ